MNNNPILSKIKKLLAKANSNVTEAEAQAFTDKATELLIAHNLTMLDVSNEETAIGKSEKIPFGELYIEGNVWEVHLLNVLASHNFCQVLEMKRDKKMFIIGSQSNVEVVEYMYVFLHRTFRNLSRQRYSELKKELLDKHDDKKTKRVVLASELEKSNILPYRTPWIQGYLKGAIKGIHDKLEEQLHGNDQEENDSTTTQLTKTNQIIALKAKVNAQINDYIAQNFGKVTESAISSRTSQIDAVNVGYKDGKSTEITKALKKDEKKQKLLN